MGSTDSLTRAQSEILNFIRERLQKDGSAPSFREIQTHFGFKAVGTVQGHVAALRKKGKLEKVENKSKGKGSHRGLRPKGFKRLEAAIVPIYGEIAAGSARETDQLEMGELLVPQEISENPSFALKVVGNSMIDAGIFEGDLLVVEKNHSVHDGDIIVALLDGETTVKRYSKKGKQISLVPENRFMKPIPVTSQRFEIQGKVVGLQRKI